MGTSHSHHHNTSIASEGIGDESYLSSSSGGGGNKQRRNSRTKLFARFGHRKSKDQLLSPSSVEGAGPVLADVDEAGNEANEDAKDHAKKWHKKQSKKKEKFTAKQKSICNEPTTTLAQQFKTNPITTEQDAKAEPKMSSTQEEQQQTSSSSITDPCASVVANSGVKNHLPSGIESVVFPLIAGEAPAQSPQYSPTKGITSGSIQLQSCASRLNKLVESPSPVPLGTRTTTLSTFVLTRQIAAPNQVEPSSGSSMMVSAESTDVRHSIGSSSPNYNDDATVSTGTSYIGDGGGGGSGSSNVVGNLAPADEWFPGPDSNNLPSVLDGVPSASSPSSSSSRSEVTPTDVKLTVISKNNSGVRHKVETIIVQTDSWKTANNFTAVLHHHHQQQNPSTSSSNTADNQLGNCDIVVLKETSSSSDSLFTDPLTPIGFQAEINQCYFSEENLCEKSDERTLSELTAAALAARNYPRQNNKCERTPRRRAATHYRDVAARLARLSQTEVTHLNLTGGRPISIDFDCEFADEEMALQLGNKLAQVLSNNGGSGSSSGGGALMGADDSGRRNSTDLGIFNISKSKKIELQNLSSRIPGGDVVTSADNLTPATIVNKQSPSTETQSTVIISYKSPPPTPVSSVASSAFKHQHQNVEVQRDGISSSAGSSSASTLTLGAAAAGNLVAAPSCGGWVETTTPIITSTTTASTLASSNQNSCAGSNVLKKVASFTVERSSQNTSSAGGSLGAPLVGAPISMAPDGGFHKRMSYVPQKLSFAAYEKFEACSVTPTTSRKRKRNPSLWKQNLRKSLREQGLSYDGKNGITRPARALGPTCTSLCFYDCCNNITDNQRQDIHTYFWSLTSEEKKIFYGNFVKKMDIKRRRTEKKLEVLPKKQASFKYYLKVRDQIVQVCKKYFLSTLSITERTIYYFFSKYYNKEHTKPTTSARKRTDEDRIKNVKAHISSFAVVDSHYCRSMTSRRYLESHLNLQRIYDLYKVKFENPVSIDVYRNIFNTEFNLSFHQPKKDLCDKCSLYKANKESCAEAETLLYEKHLEEKRYTKAERDKDLENIDQNTATLMYDLENVFTLPKMYTSNFYYKRKLCVYNLTGTLIIPGFGKVTYCVLWNETVCGRSGNDIASALIKMLNKIMEDHPNIRTLILWSDSCVPQNRNRITSTAILQFIHDHQNLVEKVIQKFSEPGHSSLQEVDCVHSVIEKYLRNIEIPSQLTLIRLLKKMNFPNVSLKILQINQKDFKNYALKSEKLNFKQVQYFKCKSIFYHKDNINEIGIKTTFKEICYNNVKLLIKPRLKNSTKTNLWNEALRINSTKNIDVNKKNDLKSMIPYLENAEDKSLYRAILKLNETSK